MRTTGSLPRYGVTVPKLPRTDKAIAAIKHAKRVDYSDTQPGLRLLVLPSGSKSWRVRIEKDGKQSVHTIGSHPDTPLAVARTKAAELRSAVKAGKSLKSSIWTFKQAAESYMKHARTSAATRERDDRNFDYTKKLHGMRVDHVRGADVYALMTALLPRDETARKLKGFCSKVLQHGVALGFCEKDVTKALPAIKSAPTAGYPALTDPTEVGALMRAIDGYHGLEITRLAWLTLMHTALRPGELRAARWKEIDLKAGVWHVPAERMKARKPHDVPLSKQTHALLWQCDLLTNDGPDNYVFPTTIPGRCLSENGLNSSLRRMGYDTRTQMSAHGARKVFSTLLNGMREDEEVIERCLAHVGEKIQKTYDKSTLWPERVALMQKWSDTLDKLQRSEPLPDWLAD
jgi:integrase